MAHAFTECTLNKNLSDNESCYVVQGIMSISVCSNCGNDESDNKHTNYSPTASYIMDLQTMYLDAIKIGMNEKQFVSNDILNVIFIDEDTKNSLIFETEGSGYANVNNNNSYSNSNNTTNPIEIQNNIIKNSQSRSQSKNIILIGALVAVIIVTIMILIATLRLFLYDFCKWYKKRKIKKSISKKSIEEYKMYSINHSMSSNFGNGQNPLLSSKKISGWNMANIVPIDEEVALAVGSI